MARTLRIEPLGYTITVAEHQTLVKTALALGDDLRSGCCSGHCRVHYRIEWPKLSHEEQAAGFTLPYVAQAETDVVLSQPWVGLKR